MSGVPGIPGILGDLGPYLASALAVLLSLVNLYLGRRDRTPRLSIRVRYEYRADGSPAVHDRTQEGLYMRLGEFLKEHDLSYARGEPSGAPLVRFAVSNPGEKTVNLASVGLEVRAQPFGRALVLDPREGRVRPRDLTDEAAGNLLTGPVRVRPGGSVGYRFELVRLSEILTSEGLEGEVKLSLVATDRAGRNYRRTFQVNTDLWASVQAT